jgi:hypothetical protein
VYKSIQRPDFSGCRLTGLERGISEYPKLDDHKG